MSMWFYLLCTGVIAFGVGMYAQALVEEGRWKLAVAICAVAYACLAWQLTNSMAGGFATMNLSHASMPMRFGLILIAMFALCLVLAVMGLAMVLSASPTHAVRRARFSDADVALVRRNILRARKPKPGAYRRLNHFAHAHT